jgi:hypothetical protein
MKLSQCCSSNLMSGRLTTAFTRPRISEPLIENLPLITLSARRVMPAVGLLR